MNLKEIIKAALEFCNNYPIVAIVFGSLLAMAIIAFIVRIAFNGIWEIPKGNKYTWTTQGGKGTTFVTASRIFKPHELSSRQKKMGENSYSGFTTILVIIVIACGLYAFLN